MNIQTNDIVRTAVEGISPEGEIYEVTELVAGESWRLRVHDTFYARVGSIITIDSVAYTVTAFSIDASLTVSGSTEPPRETFTLPAPNFFSGKYKMVNKELTGIVDGKQAGPMVYLVEPFRDGEVDELSPYEHVSEIRLLMLDHYDSNGGWLTQTHYTEVIKPMANLKKLVKKALDDSRSLGNIKESGRSINHVIAEVSQAEGGQDKSLFKWNYSGVEYLVTVPVLKVSCNY